MRTIKLAAIALAALAVVQAAVASHGGPGVHQTPLLDSQKSTFGVLKVWNKRRTLNLVIEPAAPWKVREVNIHVGAGPVPVAPSGNPVLGKFPYRVVYPTPADRHELVLDLKEDLGFGWGIPYKDLRIQNIAVNVVLHSAVKGKPPGSKLVWAWGDNAFKSQTRGWWLTYNLTHPYRGHIVDSPVEGIGYQTPSNSGLTESGGAFDFFPGEKVVLSVGKVRIGEALADHRVTPLDLFETGEVGHPGVLGVARFLQTLYGDATPKNGIRISESTVACVNAAADAIGTTEPDFTDAAQVDALIANTVALCSDLVAVNEQEARDNLEKALSTAMFRKNISKTPDLLTTKAKLEFMNIRVPATKANGDPVISEETGLRGVDYYDEEGNYLYTREKVHPLVAVYADQNLDSPTLA